MQPMVHLFYHPDAVVARAHEPLGQVGPWDRRAGGETEHDVDLLKVIRAAVLFQYLDGWYVACVFVAYNKRLEKVGHPILRDLLRVLGPGLGSVGCHARR